MRLCHAVSITLERVNGYYIRIGSLNERGNQKSGQCIEKREDDSKVMDMKRQWSTKGGRKCAPKVHSRRIAGVEMGLRG